MNQSPKWWKLSIVLVFILGLIFGGTLIVFAQDTPLSALNNTIGEVNNPKDGVEPQPSEPTIALPNIVGDNTVQSIVEQAGDAVVKIETITTRSNSGYFDDPFFRYFFGDQFNFPDQKRTTQGLGSGFIISKDGYILTNDHVVDGANEINVIINGFEEPLKATLVGSDHQLDLAVLKIDAGKDLPTLTLGDSDQTKVGEWVIAIGNPYGLDHTVTVGVISAKGRPVTVDDRQFENLLQTDASINPGNSGGPLINMRGEVIGINTAINAQAQGIGFAIPSSLVKDVIEDLKEHGGIIRPYLGVYVQDLTEDIAAYLKLNNTKGALISQVIEDSPAAAAGLKRGDVVIEFDGKPIESADDLITSIRNCKVGEKKVLVTMRQGQTLYITVTIGDDK